MTLEQIDAQAFDRFYDEVIRGLGTVPWLYEAFILPVDQYQGTFTYPPEALVPLELWYDNRTLDLMTRTQLTAMSSYWPMELGHPVAYTQEDIDLRTFKLYPFADVASDPLMPYPESPF